MSIADGAEFNFTNNTVYSNYNGIVLYQNTTRDNAYTATFDGNTFIGEADHIWIELSTNSTYHGNINVKSNNTIAGKTVTCGDIKLYNANATTGYAGIDIVLDAEGKVIGGTMKFASDGTLADGYELDENGNVIVAAPSYVATVNGVGYESLELALTSTQAGEVILLAPIVINADETVVLDLNGKTVIYNSTTQGEAMITNKGTLTINDTVGGGVINYNYTGAADPSYGKGNYTISNGGTLTVNGGKITIADLRSHAKYPIDNNSTSGDAILVINGGHLYNYNTSAIRQFCNSTTYKNSVTINGGKIEGYCAIWVQNPGKNTVNGSLSITGGEIKTTAYAYVNGTSALKDVASRIYCTIDGEGGAWSTDSAVSITGGIFNENVSFAEEAPASISVDETGATFNGYVEIPAREGLEGSGTEADPYLINNLDDLIWFQGKVDEQAADGSTQFAGKYFKLTDDINLAGINWNPIGSMSGDHGSFKGVFDGDGHTIFNLNVQQAGQGLGLFARTAGNAEIKNLTLNNVTVKSTDNSNYVGGLVGNSYASTKITNVHVTGTIDISGRGYIGGISGHGYVVMDNVSVVGTGTISSTFWCAGGILGYGGEGATNIKNAHVEGITVTSAAGGLGAIVGMAADNDGTQPISGSNLSAKDVTIKTYKGAYGDAYANYALGYLYGGNDTSILTGTNTVENVEVETSTGETPVVVDAVASIGNVIYFDLQSALDAAAAGTGEITVAILRNVNLTETIKINANITLDLNGKTITGNDYATGNFALIEIQPGKELTINDTVGTGKITLAATNNRGWNAYSSVISNQLGKLTVNGGTIEHLGGTDMAYGIDNLTNGKGTYAETIINGGTVKSTYRAIRQFLNGVEAQNILTVNRGTIEGANKSIWSQDPNENANTGTLTVGENAVLKGDVYLYVTPGSTEWPVEISIAAAALNGESTVVTGNVPEKYVVEESNGVWGVDFVPTYGKVAMIGEDELFETFVDALNAVEDGETITVLEAEGSERKTEIDFDKAITFTITGNSDYELPTITFTNATVNIVDANIEIGELDARQNATINVTRSTIETVGGSTDGIVKAYFNGKINIENSKVYAHQFTVMGVVNLIGSSELTVTWQTNVYGNGLITIGEDATLNTSAMQLTGNDYNNRDNTDADRVGKPAQITVDGGTLNVGTECISINGADYNYNSSYGINIGTIAGKQAVLDIVNGAKVNIYMANGETANIGTDGTVNVDGTLTVGCRAANGTATLVNNGSIILKTVDSTVTANECGKVTTTVDGYEVEYADGKYALVKAELKEFFGTNLTLGNELDINFAFSTSYVDQTGYAVIVREYADDRADETLTINLSDCTISGKYYVIKYAGIAAKEMCDEVKVTIYDANGKQISITKTDSIRDYILRNVDKENIATSSTRTAEETRTLLIDMLNYGAAAQVKFNYNTADLANSTLTDAQKAYGTQIIPKCEDNRSVSGVNVDAYYGTQFVLESKISMQIAIKTSAISGGTATINFVDHYGVSQTVTINAADCTTSGSYTVFTIDKIVVADGRCDVTCVFKNAAGDEVVTVVDSLESYVARNANKNSWLYEIMKFSDAAYVSLH